MARRGLAPGNSRCRLDHSERTVTEKRGTKIPGDLDRKCFEFDREIVAGILDTLQGAINAGAAQMEMVADERMFDKSLSGTFSRTAQHLNRMARKLEKLLDDVTNATGYPKLAMDYPVERAVVRRLPNRQW
jgi:hypothetical protein